MDAPREDWPFLKLERILTKPPNRETQNEDLDQQLEIAASLLLKVWKRVLILRAIGRILVTISTLWLVRWIVIFWNRDLIHWEIEVGDFVITLVLTVLGVIYPVLNWLRPQKVAQNRIIKIGAAITGFVIATFHLNLFDQIFLKWGKLDRLLNLESDKSSP